MIFPDSVDRVCMIKEVDGNIALIVLDPSSGVGSLVFTPEECCILIERITKCCPKAKDLLNSLNECKKDV